MAAQGGQWRSTTNFSQPADSRETLVERLDTWLVRNNLEGNRYETKHGSHALSVAADPRYLLLTQVRSSKPIALPEECSRIFFLAVAPADTIESLLKLPDLGLSQQHSLFFIALADSEKCDAEIKRLFDERVSRDLLGHLSFRGPGGNQLQFWLYRIDQKGETRTSLLKGPGFKIGERPDNLEGRSRWFTTRENTKD
jgi:hypothetical protein